MASQDFGIGTRAGGVDVLSVDDGNFDYNERVLVETSQRDGQDLWVRPDGGVVNQAGPFNFTIPPLDDRYIQLNRAALYVRARVEKANGERLSDWQDIVAPINLLGACMWERVEVLLNGNAFAGGAQINAGYKAYLETMLSYDTDGANTHLHTQFYHRDTPGLFGTMRVSEQRIRDGVRRALLNGSLAGPDIPQWLKPDETSEDYKAMARMRYHDANVLTLPVDASDPNNDGLDNLEALRRARQEESDFAQLQRDIDAYVREHAVQEEEEAMEDTPEAGEGEEEETPEQYRARLARNNRRVRQNADVRRRNEVATAQARADFARLHPLSERMKRRYRRDMFRKRCVGLLEDLDQFLYVQKEHPVNRGYDDRFAIVSGSPSFDMMSPITHDIFKMDNHLAPGNRLDIRLSRYPDAFLLNSLMAGENYRLVIEDMKLHYHVIERRDRVLPPPRERYLFNETKCNRQIVSGNVPTHTFRLHTGGVLPKTILLAMVWAPAADGSYEYNPWHLHHFHLKSAELIINGESYPQGGLEFDFNSVNPLVARGYRWMFENTGAMEGERGNIVSWQAFQAGSFIIPFDLTPDKCNGLHNHTAQHGYIDLQLTWDKPTPAPIYIVYETVHPKVLINDRTTSQIFSLDLEAG